MNRKTITFSRNTAGDNVTFFSFTFDGEEQTEMDKFVAAHSRGEFKPEYLDISLAIWVMADKKAYKESFRPCSTINDNVMAFPGKTDENKEIKKNRLDQEDYRVLRLYCIVLSENTVILGNGGIKSTPTYNEDPVLNEYVEILIAIDTKLKQLGYGKTKSITENLKIEIEWQ